jgi:hypothetical protein
MGVVHLNSAFTSGTNGHPLLKVPDDLRSLGRPKLASPLPA